MPLLYTKASAKPAAWVEYHQRSSRKRHTRDAIQLGMSFARRIKVPLRGSRHPQWLQLIAPFAHQIGGDGSATGVILSASEEFVPLRVRFFAVAQNDKGKVAQNDKGKVTQNDTGD